MGKRVEEEVVTAWRVVKRRTAKGTAGRRGRRVDEGRTEGR